MDILQYAIQMEKDGECFYRELLEKISDQGLRAIVTMLADEEVKHYHAIEKMRHDNYLMTETTILDDAKNIFIEMKNRGESFTPCQEQADLYAQAQKIETKSRQFYQDKASQTDNDEQRNTRGHDWERVECYT